MVLFLDANSPASNPALIRRLASRLCWPRSGMEIVIRSACAPCRRVSSTIRNASRCKLAISCCRTRFFHPNSGPPWGKGGRCSFHKCKSITACPWLTRVPSRKTKLCSVCPLAMRSSPLSAVSNSLTPPIRLNPASATLTSRLRKSCPIERLADKGAI